MPSHIRAYEHIGGATGRRIQYRAPRYNATALFDGPFPVAVIAGQPHILSDLSATGLAAIAQSTVDPSLVPGSEIAFTLQFGEAVLHQGEAGIARIEETALGRKLGLQFRKQDLDLDQIVGRYRRELSRGRLRGRFLLPAPQAPAAFRVLCADVLSALRSCQDVLDEERYGAIEDSEAMITECLDALEPVLGALAQEANRAIDTVLEDGAALAALKRTAAQLMTPEFATAPLWARAIDKPLGYPGDFRLIRALHEPAGTTGPGYRRFLERLGRQIFAWVPSRTKLLVDVLAREFAHARGADTLRVASIGAGGGEELKALFARGRPGKLLALTLLDQDEAALAHGYAVLHPQSLAAGGSVTVSCLNAAHGALFPGEELGEALTGQHVILTPTLLDYLRHRAANQLLDVLYGRLSPGGVLFAACLRQHEKSARWASELICDWSMIHRTKDEVFALAANLPRARVDVRLDKTGDIYLLVIRKPKSDH